jgi:uncharacterized membrane protein YphA (DoxX/SURF4 family)
MKNKSFTILLVFGAVLIMSGAGAFLTMSSQLSDVNREIAKILPTEYNKLDTLNTLMMERDILASRIPWAIVAAIIGGICLASGAVLRIRERRKDENVPVT